MSNNAEFENDPGTNIAPPSTNEEDIRMSSSLRSNDPLSDLHGAILNGSVAHTKTLVEIGADIFESQNGQTPLRLALCPPNGNPNKKICELLLRELINKKSWKWLEEHLNLLYKQVRNVSSIIFLEKRFVSVRALKMNIKKSLLSKVTYGLKFS